MTHRIFIHDLNIIWYIMRDKSLNGIMKAKINKSANSGWKGVHLDKKIPYKLWMICCLSPANLVPNALCYVKFVIRWWLLSLSSLKEINCDCYTLLKYKAPYSLSRFYSSGFTKTTKLQCVFRKALLFGHYSGVSN